MRARASDRLFVLGVASALAIVTSIPYAVGLAADLDGDFAWHLVFEADINAYFGFIRQAEQGAFLFTNPFTPEPHRPVVVNLEWAAVGHFARLTGLSLEAAFHVMRLVFVFVLCGALHWLAGFVLETRLARRLLLLAVATGGGFGWLLEVPALGAGLVPARFLDLSVGFHPFFWMLLQPHFLMGEALSLLTLGLFLKGEESHDLRWHAAAAACGAGVGLVRPYNLLHLLAAVGIYTILSLSRGKGRRAALVPGLLFAAPSLLVLAYYLALFRFHPVLRWWAIQNSLSPFVPSLVALALGLVVALVLVRLAGPRSQRPLRPGNTLVGCSAFAAVALYYAYPLLASSAQFSTALVVPLALVGMQGRESLLAGVAGAGIRGRSLLAAVLVVNALTSGVLVVRHTQAVASGAHHLSAPVVEAYRWIGAHARPRDVVLGSYEHSNRLPRHADVRVVCGQSFFTAEYGAKARAVERFYDRRTEERWRQAFLRRFGVRFVLAEAGAESGHDPGTSMGLREVFRNDALVVFERDSP